MFSPDLATEVSEDAEIDCWLKQRKREFQKAQVAMELARQPMIRARKASAIEHKYAVGDFVNVSTHALPLRRTTSQVDKLCQKYIGPFKIVSCFGKVVELDLPKSYDLVHPRFNLEQVRPWLHDGGDQIDLDYPEVLPQASLNPVVQILDRKKAAGRQPLRPASLMDIRAQYFVVRKSGLTEWLEASRLSSRDEGELVKKFEYRFKRTVEKPCNPVKDYSAAKKMVEELSDSEDEVDRQFQLDGAGSGRGDSVCCFFCKTHSRSSENCRKIAANKAAGTWKDKPPRK